jgi:hypothetical protein
MEMPYGWPPRRNLEWGGSLTFVEWILDQLRKITAENRKLLENYIFEDAVKRAGHRISFCQLKVVRLAALCRKTLPKFKEDEEG